MKNFITSPAFLQAASNVVVTPVEVIDYDNLTLEQLDSMTYNQKRSAVAHLGLMVENYQQVTLDAALRQYLSDKNGVSDTDIAQE